MNEKVKTIFVSFILFRISSVLFVQTSYAPDEYWQSLEVAHKMAFGYGHLTWEWKECIRSYFYPFLFFLFYKVLKLFSLDFPYAIITIPKVFQAIITGISDVYFFMLCKNFGFNDYWIKVSIFTNWFWYYCGMRTIINTLETSLTIFALYFYPWNIFKKKVKGKRVDFPWNDIKKKSLIYLTLVTINCLIRPTAATIWCPLVLFQLAHLNYSNISKFFLHCCLPAIVTVLPIFVLIDYMWYGKLVIPALNFFIFNIFKEISSFYGRHPFHWYITQGLPVVLGLHIFSFALGLVFVLAKEFKTSKILHTSAFVPIFCTVVLNILLLSNIPHKEFRFVLPLTPLMMLFSIKFKSEYLANKKKWKVFWTILLAIGFVIPSVLFGIFHQRGTLTLMQYLRSEIQYCNETCSFLFLMPCHSTPLYSHLHINVSTKFLECQPPLRLDTYDESDDFFNDPLVWLNNYWDAKKIPSHIAFFDSIDDSVSTFIEGKGYFKEYEILHTIFSAKNFGRYILVYKYLKNKV